MPLLAPCVVRHPILARPLPQSIGREPECGADLPDAIDPADQDFGGQVVHLGQVEPAINGRIVIEGQHLIGAGLPQWPRDERAVGFHPAVENEVLELGLARWHPPRVLSHSQNLGLVHEVVECRIRCPDRFLRERVQPLGGGLKPQYRPFVVVLFRVIDQDRQQIAIGRCLGRNDDR